MSPSPPPASTPPTPVAPPAPTRPALRIWCNVRFPDDVHVFLTSAVADSGHRLYVSPAAQASNLVAGPPDEALAEADVAFGQPDPDAVRSLAGLRWVHLTSAGYERYDRDDLRAALAARSAAITNSSAVYAEPCAEHALALMLAVARRLPEALDNQLGGGGRGWPAAPIRAASQLLVGQSAVILGFGAIGRRLAELLAPFHMRLAAVRRRPSPDDPIPTYPETEADRLLGEADHVINILPGGQATAGYFDAARLARLKPSAAFYNIGRGGTVDQEALRAALEGGRLAFAALDVTTPEPLPAEHPLWAHPRCLITPHTAGGHHDEMTRLARHFLDNLGRFTRGEPLADRVI